MEPTTSVQNKVTSSEELIEINDSHNLNTPNLDDTDVYLNEMQYEDERNVADSFDSPTLFSSKYQ